jgi:hypothetical protein
MHRILLLLAIIGLTMAATASPTTYTVSVSTQALAGTTGSLDFNFNPGPLVSQTAMVQILDLSGGALAGSPVLSGDASGSLPGTVSLDNGTGFNDYFQQFTYGSTLTFDVYLYGLALSAPDGKSTSGSTFAFSMFSDAAGTVPAFTTDVTDGFAYVVNVNLDGSTTVANYIVNSAAAPEPATWFLVGLALLPSVLAARTFRRHYDGRPSV